MMMTQMLLKIVVRAIRTNTETLGTWKTFAYDKRTLDDADDVGCHGTAQRATVRGHEPAGNEVNLQANTDTSIWQHSTE